MELPIDERINCCNDVIDEKYVINIIRNLKCVKRKQQNHTSIDENNPEIYCFCKDLIDNDSSICKKYYSYIDEYITVKFQIKGFDEKNEKYIVKIIDNLNFTVENTGTCRFLFKEGNIPNNYNYKNDNDIKSEEIECLNKKEQLFLFPFAPSFILLVGKEVNDFLVIDMRQITVLQNVTIKHLLNENSKLNLRLEALEKLVSNR